MFLEQLTFQVEGMKCEHCAKKVKEALCIIDGIKKVKVNLEKKEVTVFYKKNQLVLVEDLKGAVENLGYEYGGVL